MGSSDKKKRKRRVEEEDDEDEGGLTNWKLGMVVAVIVICFAVLYPTVFHPLLMSFFGGRNEPAKQVHQRPAMHPGMGARGGNGPRPDVHPAMRMAQTQAQENTQSSGFGKGYTWLLPLYTVGVVVFLMYSLFKNKTKKKKRNRYGDTSDEEDEYPMLMGKKGKDGGGKKKLKGLQARLRQTEDAMAKILEQLEKVQKEGLQVPENSDKVVELDSDEDSEDERVQENGDLDEDEVEEQQPGTSSMDVLPGKGSDQYIGDLERALEDFKILSQEYDVAKKSVKKKATKHRPPSSSEESTSSEESADDTDSESEEEEEGRDAEGDSQSEEEIEQPPPVAEKKKQKGESKRTKEEPEKESIIPRKENNQQTRRRARKAQ